jgi:hypothetical protein
VSMQIMKAQLIKERFLDDFMREQKWLDWNGFHQPTERAREMPVDEDSMAVDAIARNVGNVVRAIDDSYAPAQRLNYIEQDVIVDVFRPVAQFLVQFHPREPVW